MTVIDISTPIADTTIDLDVFLDHAGARWLLARFDDSLLVSEKDGDRMLVLTPDQCVNAEVVTLGDAIEATVEEHAPVVDIFRLSVLLTRGGILLCPLVSMGPYRWPDGRDAFACLEGPTGNPVEGYAVFKVPVVDPITESFAYDEETELDRGPFGVARLFTHLALARGARLAVQRFETKHGVAVLPAQAPSCAP
jgi:hypothetical protein